MMSDIEGTHPASDKANLKHQNHQAPSRTKTDISNDDNSYSADFLNKAQDQQAPCLQNNYIYNDDDSNKAALHVQARLQNKSAGDDKDEEGWKTTKSKNDRLLPADFVPSSYSVLLGRGKKNINSIGNRRLKVIAGLFLERYAKAKGKDEKSAIISEMQDMVESGCGTKNSAFVKHVPESGRWIEMSDKAAREKIAQTLRDCLHTKYRSSVTSKVAKRRNAGQQQGDGNEVSRLPSSSNDVALLNKPSSTSPPSSSALPLSNEQTLVDHASMTVEKCGDQNDILLEGVPGWGALHEQMVSEDIMLRDDTEAAPSNK